MIRKLIASTLVISVIIPVFLLFPVNSGQAFSVPPNPTPNPVAPDTSSFGSSLNGSLAGIGLGAAGCFAGLALGLFTGGTDYWYCIDNFIIRPVMRTIENSLENNMLNQISGVVTDKLGQGKNPHFVTDWRNSLLDSSSRGNDIFRSVLADTDLCPYFSNQLKTIFGADQYGGVLGQVGIQNLTNPPGTENFQFNNKCTLDFDVDLFKQNFSQGGGWNSWNKLIQPNNNIYGALGSALQEQSAQIDVEKKSTSDENIANSGFLPSGAGTAGNTANACSAQSLTRCIFKAKNITPGKLFGEATAKVFDQKFETIGGAQEIQDLLLALADSVINKLNGRLTNLLGSGVGSAIPPAGILPRAVCIANCQIASYPQCNAVLPPQTTLTCTQNAITACQQACP